MKPVIQFLSDSEVEYLHQCAVKVLGEIGMRFPHPDALEMFNKAGAKISGKDVVQIPEGVVRSALKTVPRRKDVVLFARNQDQDVSFPEHDPRLACMTMAVGVIDPYTRRKRPATNRDLALLTRIADRMENIAVNGGLITPQEVPAAYNDWYTWATTIKNTTKHITGGMLGARCVRDAVEMGAIALGDEDRFRQRPFISGWILTLPPFAIDRQSLDALMEMSRRKIPSIISSGPMLGASSPVTIPGSVVQAHAEILGCIVVSQLTQPGAPVIYTSFARGVNMKTGAVSMASPEFGILKVAMSQMGRFLDLPVRMPGMLRDAKVLDAQAGFETGMIGTVTGLAADLVDGMQLDMDMVVDFPDLLFCNECMGAIRRMARKVCLDEENLAMDAMKEVGPGGTYLDHPHTFDHFRTELWMPRLLERRSWEKWEKEGCRDIFHVAEKSVLEMLASHDARLLPPEVEAEIDAVAERAGAADCSI